MFLINNTLVEWTICPKFVKFYVFCFVSLHCIGTLCQLRLLETTWTMATAGSNNPRRFSVKLKWTFISQTYEWCCFYWSIGSTIDCRMITGRENKGLGWRSVSPPSSWWSPSGWERPLWCNSQQWSSWGWLPLCSSPPRWCSCLPALLAGGLCG